MNIQLSLLDPVCVEASDPDDSERKEGRRRFEAGFGSFRLLRDVGRARLGVEPLSFSKMTDSCNMMKVSGLTAGLLKQQNKP